MKRSGFIRRKTPMKKRAQERVSKKVENKGFKPPAWFMAIPYGSHGNTPTQKRFWKVCSDTWRKEDWEQDPRCRSCWQPIARWKDGHLGHFKKYSLCNSWFKFDRMNLALQCAGCNKKEDGPILHALGEYLIDKYGPNHLNRIEIENSLYSGVKMQDWQIVKKVEEIAPHLAFDPRAPDFPLYEDE